MLTLTEWRILEIPRQKIGVGDIVGGTLLAPLTASGRLTSPSVINWRKNDYSADLQGDTWRRWRVATGNKRLRIGRLRIAVPDVCLRLSNIGNSTSRAQQSW